MFVNFKTNKSFLVDFWMTSKAIKAIFIIKGHWPLIISRSPRDFKIGVVDSMVNINSLLNVE